MRLLLQHQVVSQPRGQLQHQPPRNRQGVVQQLRHLGKQLYFQVSFEICWDITALCFLAKKLTVSIVLINII